MLDYLSCVHMPLTSEKPQTQRKMSRTSFGAVRVPRHSLADVVAQRTDLVNEALRSVDFRAGYRSPQSPRVDVALLVNGLLVLGNEPKYSYSAPSWVLSSLDNEHRSAVIERLICIGWCIGAAQRGVPI